MATPTSATSVSTPDGLRWLDWEESWRGPIGLGPRVPRAPSGDVRSRSAAETDRAFDGYGPHDRGRGRPGVAARSSSLWAAAVGPRRRGWTASAGASTPVAASPGSRSASAPEAAARRVRDTGPMTPGHRRCYASAHGNCVDRAPRACLGEGGRARLHPPGAGLRHSDAVRPVPPRPHRRAADDAVRVPVAQRAVRGARPGHVHRPRVGPDRLLPDRRSRGRVALGRTPARGDPRRRRHAAHAGHDRRVRVPVPACSPSRSGWR